MMRLAFLLLLAAIAGCKAPPAEEMGRPLPPLPEDMVVATKLFTGRADCRWARPGRNRFTGDTNAALAALNVPISLRPRLLARIAAGDADGTVEAGRGGLRSDRHVLFSPRIAMTFGESIICYGTTPEFDGTQSGKLFIERGFYIWIPDVCGNISRILPRWEVREFDRSERHNVVPGLRRDAQPYGPTPVPRDAQELHDVPEPPALALLAMGAVIMIVWFWYRRYRRRVRRMEEQRRAYENDTASITGSTIHQEVWFLSAEECAEIDRHAKRQRGRPK